MTNLDYYLTCDHTARRNTTMLSVLAGIGVGIVLEQSGVALKSAAIGTILVIGAVEVTRAWRYVQPADKTQSAPDLQSRTRRSLILAPLAALLFLVVSFLPVPRIEAAVLERRIKDSSDDPFDPQNMKEAEQALIHAEASNVKLQPNVVEKAGKKFLEAAKDDPNAWKTASAFLDYRSFLNADSEPPLNESDLVPGDETHYRTFSVNPTTSSKMYAYGRAAKAQAARLNTIGADFNKNLPEGNASVVVEGDTVIIDYMDMKNVTFRNVNIIYSGGAVIMNNVCFVHCTMGLAQNVTGKLLAAKLLESPCVTFTTG
jgi:hypothetical protein